MFTIHPCYPIAHGLLCEMLIKMCSVTIVPLETSITFYGGVHEIGGNKFLVEDRGTRIFLDFGMQMGKANLYFGEFLQPRNLNGMGDLFEFDLLPRLSGLYRQDYAKHMNFDVHNGNKEP